MIKQLFILSLVSILLSFESKADTLLHEKKRSCTVEYATHGHHPEEVNRGLFTVYQSGGEWFWLIPDSLFGRHFLLSATLLQGAQITDRKSQQRFGYAGDMFPARLISFVKDRDAVLLVEPEEISPIDDNVIFAKLKIDAQEKNATLLNVTQLIENHRLFTLDPFRVLLNIGSYEPDKSFVYEMKSYPHSITIRSERSYQSTTNAQSTRWRTGVSLLLLPEKPMEKRLPDSNVGFFTQRVKANADELSEPRTQHVVKRWRLEPNADERQQYAAGELVEPRKPIVFYIDKDMPGYLTPFVKRAVEDWNSAFEQAGFKNAIQACMEPEEENTDFSMDNAAHSFISYKASAQENAYGPIVCDPRSGEIVCSHVALYHSLKNIVQKWYFAQCGIIDERARAWTLPDSLLGNLVKYVVSHEIGHALGLTHNFLGSSAFSVNEIRDKHFVKENGFGTSIMDYMRFNFAARPQDGLSNDDLIPRIGHYDRFAIEWGYRYFQDVSQARQTDWLKQWVREKQKDKRYRFSDQLPPFAREEDLSSNPVEANELGMDNLKKLMAIDTLWNHAPESARAASAKHRYGALFAQYTHFVEQAVSFLGGTYRSRHEDAEETRMNVVEKEYQQNAMAFLGEHFFTTQDGLIRDGLTDAEGLSGKDKMHKLYRIQISALIRRIPAIARQENLSHDPYTLDNYLADIRTHLFDNEIKGKQPVSENRSVLQQMYVDNLLNAIQSDSNLPKTALKQLLAHMAELADSLKKYHEEASADAFGKNHAARLAYTITRQIS